MPGVKGMKGGGGVRVGAGRKPKGAALLGLHGGRFRSAASSAPADPGGPLEYVNPPPDLPADQLEIWERLAPHAIKARTLTEATAGSFADLCRAVTLRDRLLGVIEAQGWTFVKAITNEDGTVISTEIKKHPLAPDHRGWEQRVEAGRARFMLAPIGKALVAPTVKEPTALEKLQAQAKLLKQRTK